MKLCRKCNVTYDNEELSFCYKCGNKLEEANICPKCHTENNLDFVFCAKCGTKLNENIASATATDNATPSSTMQYIKTTEPNKVIIQKAQYSKESTNISKDYQYNSTRSDTQRGNSSSGNPTTIILIIVLIIIGLTLFAAR